MIEKKRSAWSAKLKQIQAAPLTFAPNFPETARRWNDWWKFNADRPLLLASASKGGDIRRDKAFDLLDRPDEYVKVRRAQVEDRHYVGEALPVLRVDIGPVATAAFLGAPLTLSREEQTSWQEPIIESWDVLPPLRANLDNKPLRTVAAALKAAAEDAAGNYLVCLPDMTAALDVTANLRGPERLCLDLFEHREEVKRAAERIVEAWEEIFSLMYDLILAAGAGVTQWVSCWADSPFTVPTCDFNALIGPDDFKDVCMPSLREQARRAGLCVFHLDGPDAARHAETLAADPYITAVQYTPGARTPSAVEKLEMFRMIQSHKTSLFLEAPADELERLVGELDPHGLAVRVAGGVRGPREADALLKIVERRRS